MKPDLHHIFQDQLPAIKAECLKTTAPHDYIAQFGVFARYFSNYISPCCDSRHADAIFQSDATHEKVNLQIKKELRRLLGWGVAVPYLYDLKVEHFVRLCEFDAASGLDYRTLQDNRSARRRLFCWTGKCHHIDEQDCGHIPAEVPRTPHYATVDLSWEAWGIDFEERLTYVPKSELWAAHALTYERHFGLRPAEPLDLDVHAADLGDVLAVKGKHGLLRVVPIEEAAQRCFLDQMKAIYPEGPLHLHTGRAGPEAALGRLNRIVARYLAVTKESAGTTQMGLRQAYLCNMFESIAGVLAPVRGGPLIATILDRAARGTVSICAGHGWLRTSAEYVGRTRKDRSLEVPHDHPGLVRAARIKALIESYAYLKTAERRRPRDHRIDRDPLGLRKLLRPLAPEEADDE